MLTIGEFSKICCVTTKTLRYYDEIGLIKPAHINPENGYRFYDVAQLKTMLAINKLKSYELPLEDIAAILQDSSDRLLLAKITAKEQELHQRRKAYDLLLENIQKDIDNLKRGKSIMSYLDQMEVTLSEQNPLNILSSRQNTNMEAFGKYLGALYERIAKENLTITGAPITIYHDEEFNYANNDTEIAIPVRETVAGTRVLPGRLVASIRVKGPYAEQLPAGYAKLTQWIETEGYAVIDSPYEVYVNDPHSTAPQDLLTDIHFPVKKK